MAERHVDGPAQMDEEEHGDRGPAAQDERQIGQGDERPAGRVERGPSLTGGLGAEQTGDGGRGQRRQAVGRTGVDPHRRSVIPVPDTASTLWGTAVGGVLPRVPRGCTGRSAR
ncbi:hypothetical protein GCM10018787_46910 [Streptomyces thermodiastaticus]|nr:hypothetical protein GCM10018787_46910 [Streptomyces thermodiastaticus]